MTDVCLSAKPVDSQSLFGVNDRQAGGTLGVVAGGAVGVVLDEDIALVESGVALGAGTERVRVLVHWLSCQRGTGACDTRED